MSETVVALPAPVIQAPPPANKWEREHRAFLRLFPELLKSHAGQYVAIHDEQVVDSDTNERALVERVLQRVGNVSIHVGYVSERALPPLRVPHYRLADTGGGAWRPGNGPAASVE